MFVSYVKITKDVDILEQKIGTFLDNFSVESSINKGLRYTVVRAFSLPLSFKNAHTLYLDSMFLNSRYLKFSYDIRRSNFHIEYAVKIKEVFFFFIYIKQIKKYKLRSICKRLIKIPRGIIGGSNKLGCGKNK